jgi:hypothetical protein
MASSTEGDRVPDDRRVLEGASRLVVDGANVLHALSRSSAAVPAPALIGRLRAIVPPGVAITVVLDGSPEHGLHLRQVASGVEVRYSGTSSADEWIGRLVEMTPRDDLPGVLVVTNDIELSGMVRRFGGRTVRTSWLLNRLERQRLASPAPGRKGLAPPTIGAGAGVPAPGPDPDADAPRWAPGRGATRKKGNPRRGR